MQQIESLGLSSEAPLTLSICPCRPGYNSAHTLDMSCLPCSMDEQDCLASRLASKIVELKRLFETHPQVSIIVLSAHELP